MPLVERLGGPIGVEAGLLEEVRVQVHHLEVAVLDGHSVADVLPQAHGEHVLRQILVPDLGQIVGHLVAEIVLPAPVMGHPHEHVRGAGFSHERRQVLGLVALVGNGDHFDLEAGLLGELLTLRRVPFVEFGVLVPVGPQDDLLLLRETGTRNRHGDHRRCHNRRHPPSPSFHVLLLDCRELPIKIGSRIALVGPLAAPTRSV